MKLIQAIIFSLGICSSAFGEEVFYAASEEVLAIAERLQMNQIDSTLAKEEVLKLNQQKEFNSTEISLIRKYIVADYQPLSQKLDQGTQSRIDEFSQLQTSRFELNRNQKIFLSVGLAIIGGLLILDSQGKKIEFTW